MKDDRTAADALAKSILEYDAEYPGDPSASFEVDAEEWAVWIELARRHIASTRTTTKKETSK